ncbi:MAG: CHRD domain-containing protein, partial [Psychroflexus sp.]
MKRFKNFTLLLFMSVIFASCENDDDLNPVTDPILDNTEYDLEERSDSGVSGEATFSEQEDGSVQLILELEGTSSGNSHPAHIHMNSAAEGGSIIVSLAPVEGDTGLSITTFSALDDGTPISFEDIEGLDAYVNVHLSANDLGTIVAQGDIGVNELTGESKSYDLDERAVDGISGTVLFEERISGEALATISLDGTPDVGEHPAHIHMNSAAEGGDIIYTFTPVNGSTGISRSHVGALDDGTDFVYADVLEVDGYVNVHLSADDLGTIVAQGDIGENELTGESKSYDLDERAVDGISGSVLFEERVSGEALATISLNGTPDGGEHPAHIHMNTAVEGGDIIYSFNPVDGITGMSQSHVGALDDGTGFGYADVLDVDGYVNVHLSAADLGTIVAQGDIGQNELTGEEKNYDLDERAVDGISGSVLFQERVNG